MPKISAYYCLFFEYKRMRLFLSVYSIMLQDYTFLQVPMSSTSQDVVTQVSMASHVVKVK